MRYLKSHLVTLAATLISGLSLSSGAFAVSFGEPLVRSYLGQSLNVQVPISGVAPEDFNSSCIEGSVKTIDGAHITHTGTEFVLPKHNVHNDLSHAPALVDFKTREQIAEPAVTLTIAIKCGASMQRSFSLLLDYPEIIAPAVTHSTVNSNTSKSDNNNELARSTRSEASTQVKPKKSKRNKNTNNTNKSTKPTSKEKENAAATIQPSTEAAKSKETIKPKVDEQPAPSKDQLKISNEAVTQNASANTNPPPATEKAPVDVEQQRREENSLAEQRFAAMLRDDPAAKKIDEVTKEKNEQELKVHKLELELQRLKLQIENSSKPPEHHYPMMLMMMNLIVLVVLLVMLFVVGRLWLSMRKGSHPQHSPWWGGAASSTADHAQNREEGTISAPKSHQVTPATRSEQPPSPTASSTVETKIETPVQTTQPQTTATFEPQINASFQPTEPAADDAGGQSFNMFTSRRGQSIQIEELSDSTQEAEFWVSLDNPKRAIEILESQSIDENLTMPVTLLYLLDLYRQVGDEDKYNLLSTRLKRKFNIHIPGFHEAVDPSKQKHLEDYEHVTSRCCAFWNTNYILPYLESLLIDDREGDRIGFDLSVYRDILFLIAICKELEKTQSVSAPVE